MRNIDENNNEIFAADLTKGYLTEEQILVDYHPAVEAVEEVSHYEVIREYPNGGKDFKLVVDVPGVAAQEAWNEYETVQMFHPYTQEELAAMNAPTQLDRIEAQIAYTAMMTDTLLEG